MPVARLLAPSLLLAAVASTSLVATTPAQAAAPTTKNHKIVPGVSIGGVKLGMTYAEAHQRWGTGDSCSKEDVDYKIRTGEDLDRSTFLGDCYWRVSDDPKLSSTAGSANLFFKDGKVLQIVLSAAQNPKTFLPTTKGPIGKFKLPKGNLGVGGSVSKLIKAYPKYEPTGAGVELVSKGITTGFGSSAGRISGIGINPVGFS